MFPKCYVLRSRAHGDKEAQSGPEEGPSPTMVQNAQDWKKGHKIEDFDDKILNALRGHQVGH